MKLALSNDNMAKELYDFYLTFVELLLANEDGKNPTNEDVGFSLSSVI